MLVSGGFNFVVEKGEKEFGKIDQRKRGWLFVSNHIQWPPP